MAFGFMGRGRVPARWRVGAAAVAVSLLATPLLGPRGEVHVATGGSPAAHPAARAESRAARELARVLDQARWEGAAPTCFLGQVEDTPWGRRIERASVSLSVLDGDGKVVGFGSGRSCAAAGRRGIPTTAS